MKNSKKVSGVKKIYVIDTNVILHDYNSINNFQDNTVILPITVLEEIDNFKKGNQSINVNAREFSRALNDIQQKPFKEDSYPLGSHGGRLQISMKIKNDKVFEVFDSKLPDHKILAVAMNITEEEESKQDGLEVILVTKDINLRTKARALGIVSDDYQNDSVEVENILESTIKNKAIPNELMEKFQREGRVVFGSQYKIPSGFYNSGSFLYESTGTEIVKIHSTKLGKMDLRNAEQKAAVHALLDPKKKLIVLTGKAGTGKTLVALFAGIFDMKKDSQRYSQILLSRPEVNMSNKDRGALPGDDKEKAAPYMLPLYDNLGVIKEVGGQEIKSKILEFEKAEKITILPLAYIRGRSLMNAFFIIDEAQNLTPHEIKTIITRAGEGTKIIFTGDIHQIDSPYLDMYSNGLSFVIDRMQGEEIFAHIDLVKGERSELSEIASRKLQ